MLRWVMDTFISTRNDWEEQLIYNVSVLLGGEETEDDMTTIVSTEQKKKSSQDVTDWK